MTLYWDELTTSQRLWELGGGAPHAYCFMNHCLLKKDRRITESLRLEKIFKIIQSNCPPTTNIAH